MDMETLRGLVDTELHEWLDNILEMCNAPYAADNGIELVRASKDAVVMKKDIIPRDLNSNGVVHGAVQFGIIDHTSAVLGNMDVRTVGMSCNIVYFRPCFGGTIEAEARLINRSKSLVTAEVSLRCEDKLIASSTCIGFISERPKKR
ncbi:MAG: PaaI family thioesterase [Candidatus Methanoplasma sp.]|jgi:uncharacterized protein (TIGR00369 family)|nr:PaaI family thioesterase [Candidatus Methanoplasma sp.]